mgnify:CR=1 FL=1
MKTKLYFFLWICLSALLIACVDDDIEPDVIPVTGVSLNKTTLALEIRNRRKWEFDSYCYSG